MPRFAAKALESLADRIFRAAGAGAEQARIVARHLVEANLAGHDSHGLMRTIQYVREIEAGQILPTALPQVLSDWPEGSVVDARGPFGQVACHWAMARAIDKARAGTVGVVTLRHCNHSGRLGAYAAQAAEAGCFGMVAANGGGAGQWVAPFGGRERRLCTNPLAMGAPSDGAFPLLLDISTSVAPEGKVRDYLQREKPVPDGWLVDHNGRPTNDPRKLYATPSAALLPLGGAMGHKGYALAFMVDILAGALSGAGCPTNGIADGSNGTGLFMLALNIERFLPATEFARQLREMIAWIKSSAPAEGFQEVLVPGEAEHRARSDRLRRGIDIPPNVWRELEAIVIRLNDLVSSSAVPSGSALEPIELPAPISDGERATAAP
ncbi:MAG TPA: Ldh family oxidoreductase [Planctomycetaceae bacterium]|nr:Ldh family oxidoreductase [Planctomycetaceae bacterium]